MEASQNPLTIKHCINHVQNSPAASIKTGFRVPAGFCQWRQMVQWLRQKLSELTPQADTSLHARCITYVSYLSLLILGFLTCKMETLTAAALSAD